MAGTDLDDEAEQPLDPATERLRRKMVRLLAVSIGIIFVAVIAVLAAIVYKVGRDRPAAGDGQAKTLVLPQGAVIEDMAMANGEALLRIREQDREALLRIDLSTGAVLSRYEIQRR